MLDLGVVRPGSTIRIPVNTFAAAGQSVTATNFVAADILIYKDGSTTERGSTSGYTVTVDFDAKTGRHILEINLADNTTAGFYSAGSEYLVAIDSITVDSLTVGAFVARFRIGQRAALFDTTIATLASQTSFTLTAGPAEDNALNGMVLQFHDVASAVQMAWGIVTAYTGSTRTVTLAAAPTFTIAASDNVSIMWPAPLQSTVAGRTLDVSATGEAGIDLANVGSPTTSLNLSGTTISTSQAVASVSGNVTGSVGSVAAGGITSGSFASGAINAAAIAADAIGASELAADAVAEIADAVWDEVLSGHLTAGSTGAGLNAAGSAGDPWSTALPGAYGAGSAGYILGTNLDAAITSRLATAGYTAPLDAAGTRSAIGLASANLDTQLTAIDDYLDSEVAAIKAKTDQMVFTTANRLDVQVYGMEAGVVTAAAVATGAIDADALATDAVTELVTGVLTTQMTESYAADGTAPTLAQALFLVQQSLHEFAISGTTRTVKKLDGTTTAATFTLDSATAPTSTTRAS